MMIILISYWFRSDKMNTRFVSCFVQQRVLSRTLDRLYSDDWNSIVMNNVLCHLKGIECFLLFLRSLMNWENIEMIGYYIIWASHFIYNYTVLFYCPALSAQKYLTMAHYNTIKCIVHINVFCTTNNVLWAICLCVVLSDPQCSRILKETEFNDRKPIKSVLTSCDNSSTVGIMESSKSVDKCGARLARI